MQRKFIYQRRVLFLTILLLWVLTPFSLLGQEADQRVQVGVEYTPKAEPSSKVERILERTTLMELEQAGLYGVLLEDYDRKNPPELIIDGLYEQKNDLLELEYRMSNTKKETLVAELQMETQVNLFLDRTVSSAIKKLLNKAEEEINLIVKAQQAETQGQEKMQEPGLVAEAETESMAEHKSSRFQFETGATGMMLLGQAGEHLPYAMQQYGGFLYTLNTGAPMPIQLGGTVELLRFFPSMSYKAGYLKTLLPLGLKSQIQVRHKRTWNVAGWMVVGGAFRLSDNETLVEDLLTPVLPYTSAGGSILIPLQDSRFALSIQLSGKALFHLYDDRETGKIKVETIIGLGLGLGFVWRV